MRSLMPAHINQLSRFFDGLKSCLDDRIWASNKGHYRAIGGISRVDIQQSNSLDCLDLIRNLLYQLHIASFAEVGHTLDDWLHERNLGKENYSVSTNCFLGRIKSRGLRQK